MAAQGRELAVHATHFGLTPEEQEHAVSTTLTTLEREPRPFVLMGDQIDYTFTSHNVEILQIRIPQIMASDHCPITAEISF